MQNKIINHHTIQVAKLFRKPFIKVIHQILPNKWKVGGDKGGQDGWYN